MGNRLSRLPLALVAALLLSSSAGAIEVTELLSADTLAYARVTKKFDELPDLAGKLAIFKESAKVTEVMEQLQKQGLDEIEDELGMAPDQVLQAYSSVGTIHLALQGLNFEDTAPMSALIELKSKAALEQVLGHKAFDEIRQESLDYQDSYTIQRFELDRRLSLHVCFLSDQLVAATLDLGSMKALILAHKDEGASIPLSYHKEFRKLAEGMAAHSVFIFANVPKILADVRGLVDGRDKQELDMFDAIVDLSSVRALGVGVGLSGLDEVVPLTDIRLVSRENKVLALSSSQPFNTEILKLAPARFGMGYGASVGKPIEKWEAIRDFIIEMERDVIEDDDFRRAVRPAEARDELGMSFEEIVDRMAGDMFIYWPTEQGFDDDYGVFVASMKDAESARVVAEAFAVNGDMISKSQGFHTREYRGGTIWSEGLDRTNPEGVAVIDRYFLVAGNSRLLETAIDAWHEPETSAHARCAEEIGELGLRKVMMVDAELPAMLERELYYLTQLVDMEQLLIAGTAEESNTGLRLVANKGALDIAAAMGLSAVTYEMNQDKIREVVEAMNEVATALEKYKQDNGQLPAELSQLVPAYLGDESKLQAPTLGEKPFEYTIGLANYEPRSRYAGYDLVLLRYRTPECVPLVMTMNQNYVRRESLGRYRRNMARTEAKLEWLESLRERPDEELVTLLEELYEERSSEKVYDAATVLLSRGDHMYGLLYKGLTMERGAGLPLVARAWELAKAEGDQEALNEIGTHRLQLEINERTRSAWADKEAARLEKVVDALEEEKQAWLHHILGSYYHQMTKDDEALRHLEQSATIYRKGYQPEPVELSEEIRTGDASAMSKDELLDATGRAIEAQAWQRAEVLANALIEKAPEEAMGYFHRGLARLELGAEGILDDVDKARGILQEAGQDWRTERMLSRCNQVAARVYHRQGKNDKAWMLIRDMYYGEGSRVEQLPFLEMAIEVASQEKGGKRRAINYYGRLIGLLVADYQPDSE